MKQSAVSEPSRHMMKTGSNATQQHAGFQRGGNPAAEDSFEKRLIIGEKLEREAARIKYIAGIQGRDGGCCVEVSHAAY